MFGWKEYYKSNEGKLIELYEVNPWLEDSDNGHAYAVCVWQAGIDWAVDSVGFSTAEEAYDAFEHLIKHPVSKQEAELFKAEGLWEG